MGEKARVWQTIGLAEIGMNAKLDADSSTEAARSGYSSLRAKSVKHGCRCHAQELNEGHVNSGG